MLGLPTPVYVLPNTKISNHEIVITPAWYRQYHRYGVFLRGLDSPNTKTLYTYSPRTAILILYLHRNTVTTDTGDTTLILLLLLVTPVTALLGFYKPATRLLVMFKEFCLPAKPFHDKRDPFCRYRILTVCGYI